MKPKGNQVLMYIGNSSTGWADCFDIPQGQSIERLFHETMPGQHLEGFLIHVNRQPVSADTILHEGDRVTITPLQTEQAQPQPASIASPTARSNSLKGQC